jgi:Spy/CpxP family protein refolding chaperone
MKHPWILPALLLVAACGKNLDTPEGAMEASIDLTNEMTDVLKSIKDKKSAEAAKPKLEALGKRGDEIEKALSKQQPDEAVAMKYAPKMQAAIEKMSKEIMRIMQDPEMQQILGDVDFGN